MPTPHGRILAAALIALATSTACETPEGDKSSSSASAKTSSSAQTPTESNESGSPVPAATSDADTTDDDPSETRRFTGKVEVDLPNSAPEQGTIEATDSLCLKRRGPEKMRFDLMLHFKSGDTCHLRGLAGLDKSKSDAGDGPKTWVYTTGLPEGGPNPHACVFEIVPSKNEVVFREIDSARRCSEQICGPGNAIDTIRLPVSDDTDACTFAEKP